LPKLNRTFCGAEPTWANACVGDNGNPGYWTYSKGFSQAANFLIEAALKDRAINLLVDELVYPVCFNMRHSVELRLKGAIQQLQRISEIRGTSLQFNLAVSHDIKLIWEFFSQQSSRMDKRYLPINNKIDPVVLDIAQVDPTGQTFRYPISTESQKHLTDVSIINFVNLYQKFGLLEGSLETLQHLGSFLIDEYQHQTFTKHLSRHQIWEIAQKLPLKQDWLDPSFDQVRDSLKEDYGLSGTELSKAIDLIKSHYEFAPFIEEHTALLGLEPKHIIMFLDMCVKMNEVACDTIELNFEQKPDTFEEAVKSWKNDAKLIAEAWETFEPIISPQILAGLRTLFYFARELNFSEEYIVLYDYELVSAPGELKQGFVHILKKTNAVNNILHSLYFLKQVDLAEEIVQRYSLENKFSWLSEARTYQLFKKPDFCGYRI